MTTERPPRLTVEISDRDLLRAVKHASVDTNKPLKDIVSEALRDWLDRQEDEDDQRVIEERRNQETVPWEQVKAEMQQARATQVE